MQLFAAGGFWMMSMSVEIQPEPSVEEQIAKGERILEFLENLWANDEEISENYSEAEWDGLINSIEDWMDELGEDM